MSHYAFNYAKILKSLGRYPQKTRCIVVSKYQTVEAIKEVYDAGCRDFGESRVQDALDKMDQLPQDIRWHFIGTLQKNKVRKVVGKFALIHSVDSPELALKISRCAEEYGVIQEILLQSNISSESTKHGLTPSEWMERFPEIPNLKGVMVLGIMGMAPLTDSQSVIRQSFASLRELLSYLNSLSSHDPLSELSMGMSQDFTIALEEGATFIRVGSVIFNSKIV